MSSAAETGPGPADHHLGESLAALIDGELSHDRRDRVLAHLATCPSCKAEADAQRQLKSVFAHSPLPAPSDGLLARLQGLAAAGGADGEHGPPAASSRPSGASSSPPPGGRDGRAGRSRGLRLGEGRLAPSLPGPFLRIHEPAAARAYRGHRLAFAAAGAVSLAAFAIGGALSGAGPEAPTAGSNGSSTAAAGGGVSPVAAPRLSAPRPGEEERERTELPVSGVRAPLGAHSLGTNARPFLLAAAPPGAAAVPGPLAADGPAWAFTGTWADPPPARPTATGPGIISAVGPH